MLLFCVSSPLLLNHTIPGGRPDASFEASSSALAGCIVKNVTMAAAHITAIEA
jgi:hypothetical protein